MDNSLKQRLVGALVLIALAVIFLPPILKEKAEQEPFQSQIPAKPIELIDIEVDETLTQKNQQLQDAIEQLEARPRKRKLIDTTEENRVDNQQSQVSQPEDKPQNNKDTDTQTPESPDKPETIVKKPKVNETLSKDFKGAAWVIQIASFSNQANATNFVEKLKVAGHAAYKKQVKQNRNVIYRIFVGPYVDKQDAQKALKRVNKLSPSAGILLVFDPAKH